MRTIKNIVFLFLISTLGYSQKLVRAEYFIDKDPGPGKGFIIPGVIKSDSLDLKNISIPSTGLSEGAHVLGLRVRDSLGMWSSGYMSSFSILSGNGDLSTFNKSKLVRAEYFIDNDPGPGKGIAIPGVIKSDSLDIKNISIPSTGLSNGAHVLGLRVRDSLGMWSSGFMASFSILGSKGDLSTFNNSKLVQAEYFVDKDPGPGKGTAIPGVIKSDSVVIKNISIPSTGLSDGSHVLGLRVRDSLGMWSPGFMSSFSILRGNGDLSNFNKSKLVLAEYFIDKDPGPGKGTAIPGVIKSDSLDLKRISIPSTGLAQGPHVLGLRVRDSLGIWSTGFMSSFSILNSGGLTDTTSIFLVSGEYFFGSTDPGLGKGTSFTTPAKAQTWDVTSLSIPIPTALGISLDNIFTFRIKQDNGLWSANQTVKFDVCLPVKAAPVSSGTTICGGSGTTTLVASGPNPKNYSWFTSSWDKASVVKTSKLNSATDTNYTTPNLTASSVYWVAVVNPTGSSCPYGLRTKVPVDVVDILLVPVVPSVTRCGNGKVIFTASGGAIGSTYRWFNTDTSKTWLFEGSPYITDSISVSRSFSVVSVSNGGKCKSSFTRPAITIKTCTAQTITFPFVNDLIFGFDKFALLKATSNSGLPVEYQLVSGTGRLSNDTVFPTSIGEITIRASQPGNTEFDPAKNVILRFRSVAGSSTILIDYNRPLCTGNELKLIATAIKNGKYFWTGPNGFTSTEQSPVIYNVAIRDSGVYYVTVKSPNDTLRSNIQVNVYKSPLNITLYSSLISQCTKEYKAFTKGDSIVSYQWLLNAKEIVGATDSVLVPSITGVYSVLGINRPGCTISSSPVYINVDPDTIPTLSRLRSPSRLITSPAQYYQWYIDNYIVAQHNEKELPLIFNGSYKVMVTDSKGCNRFSLNYTVFEDNLPSLRSDNVMPNGTVDIYKEQTALIIAPQPSNYLAHINWSSPLRGNILFELVDSKGKSVLSEMRDKENEVFAFNFPVNSLPDGLYIVRLTCDGKQAKGKLIVIKE